MCPRAFHKGGVDLNRALPVCKAHVSHHYFACHKYTHTVIHRNDAIVTLPSHLPFPGLLSLPRLPTHPDSTPQWACFMSTHPGHLSRHRSHISEPHLALRDWNTPSGSSLVSHLPNCALQPRQKNIFSVFLLCYTIFNRTNTHESMSSLVNATH